MVRNTSAKGQRAEDRLADWLKGMGYRVHVTKRAPARLVNGKWVTSGNTDLFGLFDVVATKPSGEVMHWIQVSHPSQLSQKRSVLRGSADFLGAGHEPSIAIWHTPPKGKVTGTYRFYRRGNDYLEADLVLESGDTDLPWLLPPKPKQVKL